MQKLFKAPSSFKYNPQRILCTTVFLTLLFEKASKNHSLTKANQFNASSSETTQARTMKNSCPQCSAGNLTLIKAGTAKWTTKTTSQSSHETNPMNKKY